MPVKSITFEQVLYAKKLMTAKASKYTEFGFVSDSVAHKGITVNGWPSITPGQTVTVALRKLNDFRTLVGWIDNSTGEVVEPDALILGFTALVLLTTTLICAYYTIVSLPNPHVDHRFMAFIATLFGIWAAVSIRSYIQTVRAWSELLKAPS